MDLYIVLGVERDAETGEIKRAYKRLARRLHPDINPGDREAEARFRQVLDAYETLIDPDRRRAGHGARLLAAVMQAAAREGATAATLEVRRSNRAALALYERMGFRVEAVRVDYYEQPREDALVLWCRAWPPADAA